MWSTLKVAEAPVQGLLRVERSRSLRAPRGSGWEGLTTATPGGGFCAGHACVCGVVCAGVHAGVLCARLGLGVYVCACAGLSPCHSGLFFQAVPGRQMGPPAVQEGQHILLFKPLKNDSFQYEGKDVVSVGVGSEAAPWTWVPGG